MENIESYTPNVDSITYTAFVSCGQQWVKHHLEEQQSVIKQLPFLQLPDPVFEWSHHAEVGYTADFSKHPCFLHLFKGEVPIPWPLLLLTVYIPYLSNDA